MTDLQSKTDALGHLVKWRSSGKIRTSVVEEVDAIMISLAKEIKDHKPDTVTGQIECQMIKTS